VVLFGDDIQKPLEEEMIRDVDELTDAWENIEDSNSFCILSIL